MRLHDVLDHHARERPESEFATTGARRLTYAEATAETDRLASALVERGLKPGDRVAILAKNSLDYILLYFAASKAALILLPLNTRLAPPEWSRIIADAEARLIIVGPEFVASIEQVRADLPAIETLVSIGPVVPTGWLEYRAWLAGAPTGAPDRRVSGDDDLLLIYTSGTTGSPKGVLLAHRNVLWDLVQTSMTIPSGPGDRWLAVAPLFHVGGAISNVLVPLYTGASVYLMADFVPAEVVRVLDEERINIVLMVPAMIQACLGGVPGVAERRYADLRMLIYGAAPCPEAVIRQAMQVFGCEFYHGYGMTECAAGISRLLPSDLARGLSEKPALLRSVGRPFMGTEVRIADPEGRMLAVGELGEILIRGPQVTRGYWRRPDETAAAFRGGWLRSGDAGRFDDEGYLYIEDRIKDMIITGGENVYPTEVETVLREHPAIAEVAVIGVPDPQWGEAIKAIVVLKPGMTADGADIIEFCRGKIGGYKRPRSVDFVESLPRSPLGKVIKAKLREPYLATPTGAG